MSALKKDTPAKIFVDRMAAKVSGRCPGSKWMRERVKERPSMTMAEMVDIFNEAFEQGVAKPSWAFAVIKHEFANLYPEFRASMLDKIDHENAAKTMMRVEALLTSKEKSAFATKGLIRG